MKDRVAASLRAATRNGELPVVCDASSCSEGLEVLLEAAQAADIRVVDAVAFADEVVLPKLPVVRTKYASLTVRPTCSSTRLGVNPALLRIAGAAAERVTVPDNWRCCAFAGDRGMLHPELTASAAAGEAADIRTFGAVAHASLNRTCELGLTRASGQPYRQVREVLDGATCVPGSPDAKIVSLSPGPFSSSVPSARPQAPALQSKRDLRLLKLSHDTSTLIAYGTARSIASITVSINDWDLRASAMTSRLNPFVR